MGGGGVMLIGGRDVGAGEVLALEQERPIERLGDRVAHAIAEVEPGGVTAAAAIAGEGEHRLVGHIRIEWNHLYLQTGQ